MSTPEIERRTSTICREECDLNEMWNLLRSIDTKLTVHLAEHDEDKPKLDELLTLFSQSKGVIRFVRITAYIAAAGFAAVAWFKDHFKLL